MSKTYQLGPTENFWPTLFMAEFLKAEPLIRRGPTILCVLNRGTISVQIIFAIILS